VMLSGSSASRKSSNSLNEPFFWRVRQSASHKRRRDDLIIGSRDSSGGSKSC
jgi:hypothetical protein